MKWTEIPAGQLHAAQQRLMAGLGEDASCFVDRINQDSSFVTHVKNAVSLWEERDGIIYCNVTSYGRTGVQWLESLHHKGFDLHNRTEKALRWGGFKFTSGVIYHIGIVKGSGLSDEERTSSWCEPGEKMATEKGMAEIENYEAVCLIQERLMMEPVEKTGLRWIYGHHFGLPLSAQVSREEDDPACLRDNPHDTGNDICVFRPSCGFVFNYTRNLN
jgi:hypothetical protein